MGSSVHDTNNVNNTNSSTGVPFLIRVVICVIVVIVRLKFDFKFLNINSEKFSTVDKITIYVFVLYLFNITEWKEYFQQIGYDNTTH